MVQPIGGYTDQGDQGQPQAPQGPARPAQQAPGSDMAQQWSDWMDKPGNRAALLQFGIAMLQPMGIGESQIGHFASSIGSGAEAAGRVGREQLAEQMEASKEDLRAAQAELAEGRARTAGSASETAAGKLDIARQGLDLRRQQYGVQSWLNAQAKSQNAYNAYVNAYKATALPGDAPAMSQQEFMQKFPEHDPRNILGEAARYGDPGAQAAQEQMESAGKAPEAKAPPMSAENWVRAFPTQFQRLQAMVKSGQPDQINRAREIVAGIGRQSSPRDAAVLSRMLGIGGQ